MGRFSRFGRILTCLLALGALSDAMAQYGGPSLLSRGGNRPGRRGRAVPKLNGYVSVRGMYEAGLRAAVLDESGEIKPINSPGTVIEGGLYGGKDWRRLSVGVDYRGDYRYLTNPGNATTPNKLNGSNQAIAIDSTYRLTRRTTIGVSETGGTTNRAFGAFAAPAFGDTSRLGVPLNEVFDVRTYFSQAEVTVQNQRSARMILMGTMTGFFVRREQLSLINSQGYRALGGFGYRTSRRTTLIGNYQWMNFSFPKILSASNTHGISLGVEHRFSESWRFVGVGGLYLINSTGAEQVILSPEVAEILGRPVGQAFFRRSKNAPLVDVSVTYTHERGSLRMAASSAVVPGNGVYLTSTRQTANVGYSYAGTRRLSIGVNAGVSRTQSASLSIRNLRSWQAGGGITYRLTKGLNFMSQMDRRTFQTNAVSGRDGYAISVGLAYNPSRFPISIW